MITVKKGEVISIEDFKRCAIKEGGVAEYEVSGLDFYDCIDFGMEELNDFFLNHVEKGWLLMDIGYKFCDFDTETDTISVKVTVADVSEWLREI